MTSEADALAAVLAKVTALPSVKAALAECLVKWHTKCPKAYHKYMRNC